MEKMSTDNLKPDVKEKWLKALRSRKYQQGTGFLRSRDNQFCCLGVLCDILDLEWELDETRSVYAAYDPSSPDFSPEDTRQLPRPTRRAVGLSCQTQSELMDMNDREQPFEVIADFIEDCL